METLLPLNARPMKTYKGDDITQFEKIETEIMTHYLRCFEADKLDKIITMKAEIQGGKVIVWGATIVPADEYSFPIFVSEIAQTVNHLSLIVDLIPLADCAQEKDYLEKYMVPLEDVWKKYKDTEGMRMARYLWHRAMLSPLYCYGKFTYDAENIEEKSLEITIDYLKLYTKFWSEAKKEDPFYMESLNGRKRAVLKTMMANDPGGGPLKKSFGKQTAQKILDLLF
jgi:hypothetical protein